MLYTINKLKHYFYIYKAKQYYPTIVFIVDNLSTNTMRIPI
jgi:hypothetical protein